MEDSGGPEFMSATAGGWKANLIVEAWSCTGGAAISNSVGLAVAAHHSGGRHVCIVAGEKSRQEYTCAMQSTPAAACVSYPLPEVMVGEAEELMERLNGIDFLVVDGGREDFGRVFSHAKFGHLGAVVVWQNGHGQRAFSGFRWSRVLDNKASVVRSMFLPIGNGLDIAYIAGEKSSSLKLGPNITFFVAHQFCYNS